ncbi:aldo/keto reductase [Gordonia sp. DT219]|uniref:aldo/keto reductase n=1 Tax=Gordonia sp. DT219 TaxID=3416658 RepID=UPI003CF53419
MRYQPFGRLSGLRVSQYVLGTANFGSSETSTGLDGAKDIYRAFLDAGGTTFDSSNIYQVGEAEAVLGDLLGSDRDDMVVITKYSGTRRADARPGTTGNSRKVMFRSLDESLRRLQTDYVDVFMPHFPDGLTPMSEIQQALEDLVRAGKIRYYGLSNFPAWRVAGAAVRSELTGGGHLLGIQTEYNLAERSAERELLPMAQAHGLGVVLYSPLAGGLLSGKYRNGEQGRLSTAAESTTPGEDTEQRTTVLDAVISVADQIETGPVQVALSWLHERAARSGTSMIPIVGPRTSTHLQGYLDALDVDLDDAQYALLDDVSAVPLGTPHDDVAAALTHGIDGNRQLIDDPALPVT